MRYKQIGENSYMIKNKFYSLMTSAAVLTTLAGAPFTAVIANAANTTSDQTAQVKFTGVPNGPEITTTTPDALMAFQVTKTTTPLAMLWHLPSDLVLMR